MVSPPPYICHKLPLFEDGVKEKSINIWSSKENRSIFPSPPKKVRKHVFFSPTVLKDRLFSLHSIFKWGYCSPTVLDFNNHHILRAKKSSNTKPNRGRLWIKPKAWNRKKTTTPPSKQEPEDSPENLGFKLRFKERGKRPRNQCQRWPRI